MKFLYFMPLLDQRTYLSQHAVVRSDVEIVHGRCLQTRYAGDRWAVLDHRFEHRTVERLVQARDHFCTPIIAERGKCADEGVRPPIRDAGHDQMARWCDARDRLAVRDVPRDQRARDRAHPDLVTAVADSDRLPRTGREKLIEWCRVGTDILASHIA